MLVTSTLELHTQPFVGKSSGDCKKTGYESVSFECIKPENYRVVLASYLTGLDKKSQRWKARARGAIPINALLC